MQHVIQPRDLDQVDLPQAEHLCALLYRGTTLETLATHWGPLPIPSGQPRSITHCLSLNWVVHGFSSRAVSSEDSQEWRRSNSAPKKKDK